MVGIPAHVTSSDFLYLLAIAFSRFFLLFNVSQIADWHSSEAVATVFRFQVRLGQLGGDISEAYPPNFRIV